MDVFAAMDPEASLVFAPHRGSTRTTCSPGLRSHRGPILTVANWSGRWPANFSRKRPRSSSVVQGANAMLAGGVTGNLQAASEGESRFGIDRLI
jgi:hypothetical protein